MEMPSSNNSIINDKDRLIGLFNRILSTDSIISDPYETKAYECDGLTAYKCPPLAVLLPRTTEEVSEILKICHEEKVPVIPRGAGTSLSGGALPTSDSVILGTSRLNNILDLDIENRMVRVQTGVTNLSVTEAVENEGFF